MENVPQGQPVRTWLFQIVVHAFRDRGRRRGGTDSRPGDWVVEDPRAPDPVELASTAERGRIVAQTVSRLPPRQREVLVLHVYEQLSIAEVSAMLGISETNVRAHLSYSRTRLKEWLAPYREQESRERGPQTTRPKRRGA
jgi:RNA polymerase sigma-70 factor (ECF subfamily)